MIEVPGEFVRDLVAGAGDQGRAWLVSLPGVIDELLQRWCCAPAGAVRHGRVGIVVPVRRRGLPPAVIKVSFPGHRSPHEPTAFAIWNGAGAVHLFERDDDCAAMLLERARSRTLAVITDPEQALTIQGRLSRRLAVPAPPGLPKLSDIIGGWEHEIATESAALGGPLPAPVVAAALATLRELGADQPNSLIHGDLHDANVLASDREPWLAIDPKAHVGDPAYEALYVFLSPRFGPLLTTADPRLTLHRYLNIYCEAAELDRERARRWIQAGAAREALLARRSGEPARLVRAFDTLAVALV